MFASKNSKLTPNEVYVQLVESLNFFERHPSIKAMPEYVHLVDVLSEKVNPYDMATLDRLCKLRDTLLALRNELVNRAAEVERLGEIEFVPVDPWYESNLPVAVPYTSFSELRASCLFKAAASRSPSPAQDRETTLFSPEQKFSSDTQQKIFEKINDLRSEIRADRWPTNKVIKTAKITHLNELLAEIRLNGPVSSWIGKVDELLSNEDVTQGFLRHGVRDLLESIKRDAAPFIPEESKIVIMRPLTP